MPALTLPVNELNSFDLPPVCLVTGQRANVTFHKVKFSWFPRWVFLLGLVPLGTWLLALIVGLVLMKRAAGELPFSEEGWSRWRLVKAMRVVSSVFAIAALFIGLTFMDSGFGFADAAHMAAAFACWGLMVAVPLAIYFAVLRNRRVMALRITETEILLEIPSEEAAMAIREHLHAGQAVYSVDQAVPLAVAAR